MVSSSCSRTGDKDGLLLLLLLFGVEGEVLIFIVSAELTKDSVGTDDDVEGDFQPLFSGVCALGIDSNLEEVKSSGEFLHSLLGKTLLFNLNLIDFYGH